MESTHNGVDTEAGVAAVEFALISPFLLVLVLALFTAGHGLVIKYLMSSAAYSAARECTLQKQVTQSCAQTAVNQRIGEYKKWCGGSPTVTTQVSTSSNAPTTVNLFAVDVKCSYSGVVGTEVMKDFNLTFTDITGKAAMPY